MKLQELLEMNLRVAVPLDYTRMADLAQDASIHSFGITGFERQDRPAAANIAAKSKVLTKLNEFRLDYYEIKGAGQEKDENGHIQMVYEPSILVVGPTYAHMRTLAETAQQNFFIYAGEVSGGQIVLYDTESQAEVLVWTKVMKGANDDGYTILQDGTPVHFA